MVGEIRLVWKEDEVCVKEFWRRPRAFTMDRVAGVEALRDIENVGLRVSMAPCIYLNDSFKQLTLASRNNIL